MRSTSRKSALFGLLGLAILALVPACGGAQPAEPAPPPGPEAAPATPEPPAAETAPAETAPAQPAAEEKVKFDDMEPAQKLQLMKTVVAPEMGKLFQSVDAEKYKDFGCVTCHGPGAKDGKFDMPSASIPKLPKDIASVFKSKPEVAKFMAEQVVPKMAGILGEEPYNPETHEGFGCGGCHQTK
jgi:hypothetical protein